MVLNEVMRLKVGQRAKGLRVTVEVNCGEYEQTTMILFEENIVCVELFSNDDSTDKPAAEVGNE